MTTSFESIISFITEASPNLPLPAKVALGVVIFIIFVYSLQSLRSETPKSKK